MQTVCRIHIICLLFCCLSADEPLCAQIPIQCDHKAYLSLRPFQETGPYPVYRIAPDQAAGFDLFFSDLGVFLSCLGYSTTNALFGLNPETYELYKIGPDGTPENLGIPPDLDTSYFYRAGTMAPDGIRMVLVAQNKITGFDEKIFSVRTDLPDLATGSTSIISDVPVRIGDIAFDPFFGNGYGFDEYNQRLVNIGWPGGLVTSFSFDELNQITGMGSLFFDTLGVLFAYGSTSTNSAETTLFAFDKTNGKILSSRGGPGGLESDACNCPYRIRVNRIVSEKKLIPCQAFTVQYAFWNTAGTVYTNISLYDNLPPGFEIMEIIQAPYPPAGFSQGVGGAVLSYDEFDLLLGKDTLIISVQAPAAAGTYSMQAFMDPFPAAFDYIVSSDDPFVLGQENPNVVEVIGDGAIFPNEQTFLCPGGSIRLESGLSSGEFEWSDGSNLPFLDVYAAGLYWIAVTGDCGVYRDTIQVDLLQAPLQVDLGPDLELRIGSSLELSFTSNSSVPLNVSWEASDVPLNCDECLAPLAGPFINDTWIALHASNDFGCIDSDTLHIRVLKDRAVYLPNVFSPNGDGINDMFYPQSLEAASIHRFQVFDRWGQLVYEQTSGLINQPAIGWNGQCAGRDSPQGIYVWQLQLTFADGFEQRMAGDVLLSR
ncbi:MAG: gliding motility-associated C-terminal domain-containing protein [Saprospiraceae bacterium]|nr:gliding motility-associated C-terminal domain-containing protein [Saprospiraceae bacterium]